MTEEEALEKIKEIKDKNASASGFNISRVWSENYKILEEITDDHPELSHNIMEVFSENFTSQIFNEEKNNFAIREAYVLLEHILKASPELSEKILDVLKYSKEESKSYHYPTTLCYGLLASMVTLRPDLSASMLDTTEIFVKSEQTYDGYNKLVSKLIKGKPELAEKGLDIINYSLSLPYDRSHRNNDYEYLSAVDVLNDAVEMNPELAAKAISAIANGIEHNIYFTKRNWYYTYRCLNYIYEKNSTVTPQILRTLQSFDKYADYADNADSLLINIMNSRPDLAKECFGLLKSLLKNSDLVKIVVSHPELKEQISDKIKIPYDEETLSLLMQNIDNPAIEDFWTKFDAQNTKWPELVRIGLVVANEVKNHPELANNYVDIIKKFLANKNNRYDTIGYFLSSLNEVLKTHPEKSNEIFNIYREAFNELGSTDTLRAFYNELGDAIVSNPELMDSAYSLYSDILHSDKNGLGYLGENTTTWAYKWFQESICDSSQLADDVFTLFESALGSCYNNMSSTKIAYNAIENIIDKKPEFINECLELLNTSISWCGNYDIGKADFETLYEVLKNITIKHPEVADKTFKLYNDALNSNENNSPVKLIYEALENISVTHPELVSKTFKLFEAAFLSDKNKYSDLLEGYKFVEDISNTHAKMAENILNFLIKIPREIDKDTAEDFEITKDTHYRIFSNLDSYFYGERNNIKKNILSKISSVNPELSEKILSNCDEIVIDGSHCIYVYKSCMKHLPLEETIAKHPEMEQDLRLAHKGRFSNDEEFQYALDNFDKKTLAESMVFRAQQRVMNVLVSASAQENGIPKEEALAFRKSDAPEAVKNYMTNNNDWLIPASFKGAAIFKDYFPAYIKTIQNHNQKNPEDKLSIHDAVYWLPEPMSKEANERFAQFIQKNIIYQTIDESGKHKMAHRPLNELKIIAQNWKALENRLQNREENAEITKLKYNDVLSICMSVKYEDQRNDVFAVEAAKHGTPEAEYHNCEDIYLAGLKVPEPFDSKKEFKEGKYTGRFLPREDPRTLFFGDYTNCCQHYGGAGHACAVSTVKHPFSQLFVIEDEQGKIIAGSWTWENTEGKYREVCFDNIESLGELSSRPELNKIYEQVGDYLTKEQNCHKVTIGLGYQDADVSGYASTESVPLPKLYGNSYSDARSQVLLSENPNAEPLDKSQESQRYIRDVCFLDMEAMDRVSEAVFPDGDKQLQAPDNMAGFVIEDREKGVVGYCLYDKEEKSIYDMAVLPEYRTDKNASSKKLFAEMMRTINKEGGQWSAEMRDETTLKYLKVMAERGLVKYEEHGIDHTMSDGSKVVAVTFEPIKRDVRQATEKLKQHIEASKETSVPAQSTKITKGKIGKNPTVYE